MDDDLLLLAVIGTGVALATSIMIQLSGFKREIRSELAELRRELNSLGNRVASLEGVIDMIRMGMQLPKPPAEIEKADAS